MSKGKFRLDWYPSSSAEVELYDPGVKNEGVYQLKYTPPFRTTIRPPVGPINLGQNELDIIDQNLNELATVIAARASGWNAAGRAAPTPAAGNLLQKMQELGDLLYTLTIPPYIRTDLRAPGLFFEIGMDESLLSYPWELMYDGDDFICLKHNVGRFVNGTTQNFDLNRPPGQLAVPFDKLKVLLIVVSKPLERPEGQYDQLPEAEVEAHEIAKILGDDPDIDLDVIPNADATFVNVSKHLTQGGYQVIHFCGHAKFDDKNPRASSLVLLDRDLTTNAVYSLILRKPPAPVLCFINGCETAKPVNGKDQFNVFGLARSFLETGTYLLGTRWKVNDIAARNFAPKFYSSLLMDSKSLGSAIREARQACKDAAPVDDFSWASYILYGDPRVIFSRVKD